jgi:hypothetical protein
MYSYCSGVLHRGHAVRILATVCPNADMIYSYLGLMYIHLPICVVRPTGSLVAYFSLWLRNPPFSDDKITPVI